MILDLLLGALAVWTFSSLLVGERGPFDMFVKIRDAAGVMQADQAEAEDLNAWMNLHPGYDMPDTFAFNLAGEILSCFWCTSMWVSFGVIVVIWSGFGWLLWPFALRTLAIVIDEFINGTQNR
jgi:hypothetical protein